MQEENQMILQPDLDNIIPKPKKKKRARRNRVSQRVNIEPKIREYKRPRQAVKRPAIAITLTDIMFDFDSDFQVLVGGLKEVEKLTEKNKQVRPNFTA